MPNSTVRSRNCRNNNPAKYAYSNLKTNSKRRNILFELSFEQFLIFCRETRYLQGVGKTKDSFSIDRIDPRQGYHILNICILPLSENSSKGKKLLVYDWMNKYAKVIDVYREYLDSQEIDNPF